MLHESCATRLSVVTVMEGQGGGRLTRGAERFPPDNPPNELFPNPGMRYDCAQCISEQSRNEEEEKEGRTYIPERSLMKHIVHRRIMKCSRILDPRPLALLLPLTLLLRLGSQGILPGTNERFHSCCRIDVRRMLRMRIWRRGSRTSAGSGIRPSPRELVFDQCSEELRVKGGSVRIVHGAAFERVGDTVQSTSAVYELHECERLTLERERSRQLRRRKKRTRER